LIDATFDPPTVTTYGAWPDDHPAITAAGLSNGGGSDIRTNWVGDAWSPQGYPYIYCEVITDQEFATLNAEVAKNFQWSCTNNCASFASETFLAVTGTDVDADELLGLETTREVGQSIRALNGGSNQSDDAPSESSSVDNSSSSSFDGATCEACGQTSCGGN
jgi:hypothetical protein